MPTKSPLFREPVNVPMVLRMAPNGANFEVEGRFNTSTRIATWLKGAVVDVGLDAASVDVLCMVLDLDYDKAVSTNQLQHWRKGLLDTAQRKSGKPCASCSRT